MAPLLMAALALAAALVTLVAASPAEAKRGCGIWFGAPQVYYQSSDAAIIGQLVKFEDAGRKYASYTYRVSRVYRDRHRIGSRVTVKAGPRCLPRLEGETYGLFLIRDRHRWLRWGYPVSPTKLEHLAARLGDEGRTP